MSELLDRAAEAIAPMLTFGVTEFPDARAVARAVLEAVRDPTGEMIEAAAKTYGVASAFGELAATILDGQPSKAYRAMIDAALSDV